MTNCDWLLFITIWYMIEVNVVKPEYTPSSQTPAYCRPQDDGNAKIGKTAWLTI